MDWISSQKLAELLNWKTSLCAIKWAKKEGINYFRKGSGYLGRYWFNKKQILAKLDEMNKIVTARDARNILGISQTTLRRWIKQENINPIGRGKRNTPLFKKSKIIRFKPKTRFWAPWQKTYLENYYNRVGGFYDKITKKLGKSLSAVRSKVSHLGLGKNNQREFYFLKDVVEAFGTNRRRVSRWIKSGKLEAVPLISIGGRIKYRISEEEIAKFMALYLKSWRNLKPLINFLELKRYKKLYKKT